ncbi:fibronectin type III domain-containing protein [Listeria monocytogenes]|nr:fibronectin type III domain-containing protein [Listeria monocytogenes]
MKKHPQRPQKADVIEFTDSSITYSWDPVAKTNKYLIYFDDLDKPVESTSTTYKREGLEQMTKYVCSISAVNGSAEGEKSEKIEQKTRISPPVLDRFITGQSYLTGTTLDNVSIVHAPIYSRAGDYIANGSVTNGAIKLYLNNNNKIIPGETYTVYVLDGKLGADGTIQSMPAYAEIIIPDISLDDVKTAGHISGTTEPNIQVRIYINDVAKTVVTVGNDGKYSWEAGILTAGDVVKVETKVGSVYSSFKEKTVTQ